MKLRRVKAMAWKELLHVLRDPRSPILAFVIPVALLLLFGSALALDVDHVPLAVWDRADTPGSRQLVAGFVGSRYFDVSGSRAGYPALERAVDRVLTRRGAVKAAGGERWLREFWVPHRSELLRIDASQVERIDAERDYVRLHVGQSEGEGRSYLLLQTIAGLEAKLDPEQFIRIHRSTILRRDQIRGLRHEGLGVWSAEIAGGEALRIGRTYLRKVKAMAGR